MLHLCRKVERSMIQKASILVASDGSENFKQTACREFRISFLLAPLFLGLVLVQANGSSPAQQQDWLLQKYAGIPSTIIEEPCNSSSVLVDPFSNEVMTGICGLTLTNGLISRQFRIQPAFGLVDYMLHASPSYGGNQSFFRDMPAEALVVLSSNFNTTPTTFRVGDLSYERNDGFKSYCNRTHMLSSLYSLPSTYDTNTFRYVSYSISKPTAPFPWTPGTRHSLNAEWPPRGITLHVTMALKNSTLLFPNDDNGNQIYITMHYEIYDGVPVVSKWLTINISSTSTTSSSLATVKVESVTVEMLPSAPPFANTNGDPVGAFSYPFESYNGVASQTPPNAQLHVLTDQAHSTQCQWIEEPDITETGNVVPPNTGAALPFLICSYIAGPGATLSTTSSHSWVTSSYDSFRVLLLATDSINLERHILMRHRMTQVLIPHVTENPIFFHFIPPGDLTDDQGQLDFRHVVDQLAEVGFEMIIYSFGSSSGLVGGSFTLETYNETYIDRIAQEVAYANSKGLEVGGYDLICLARGHGGYGGNVGDQWTALNEFYGSAASAACYASGWVDELNGFIFNFLDKTGISMLELDGPYAGMTCSSQNHSHHEGEDDSVYQQMLLQSQLFSELRTRGVYLNQPDNYFYEGGSRTAMGYNEDQFSLPRWHDLHISRMGMYDDLYRLLPTQGWMFVPLDEYHSGGANATFQNHVVEFEWALAQYMGAGAAAAYRGQYLYDNTTAVGQQMKATALKWVTFYKTYRETLIQPIIHLRRPTMQSWDGWMVRKLLLP